MNLEMAHEKLNDICHQLHQKGYCQPQAFFKGNDGGRSEVFFMAQENSRYSMEETISASAYSDDLQSAFTAVYDKLDAVVPNGENQRKRFIQKVARTLEDARALGLDDVKSPDGEVIDFVAHFEELMKSLSDNILTHDRSLDAAE
jgi:hypothetical protein